MGIVGAVLVKLEHTRPSLHPLGMVLRDATGATVFRPWRLGGAAAAGHVLWSTC